LRWLRKLIQDRKLNAAALAEKAGVARARIRKVLAGTEPMTVDELLQLTSVLDLSPTDLGMGPNLTMPPSEDDAPPVEPVLDPREALPGLDPYGNQVQQLFHVGFTLGCDILFHARVADLAGSGIPDDVLKRFASGDLPLKLDAAYHQHNNPRYDATAITLSLSFDAVYECRFPWSSIRLITFFPATFESPEEEEQEPEAPEERPKPHLRLV
jgi:transcriptional regulator with XRE-family HTH domain